MELAELKACLEKHLKWLRNEDGGERADMRRADLRGADLSEANLSGAVLYGANLRGADLSEANLCGSNLYEANLSEANLREANLYRADLYEADLCRADMYEANLCESNLYEADLYGANLRGANLRGADMRRADMRRADLRGADLSEANLYRAELSGANLDRADMRGANLRGANLYGANLSPELITKFFSLACPEEGAFIGWKKAYCIVDSTTLKQVIVKLQIPEDARRSSAFGRKCRCDKAVVLAIESIDGGSAEVDLAISQHDSNFYYRVGETVSVDNFDTDRTHECAPGIHFFITRQEAVDY